MGIVENWLSNIDKEKMAGFFKQTVCSSLEIITSEFDEDYGKIFYCHTYNDLSDITGIDGFGAQLGNFGVVRSVDKENGAKLYDDFLMAKLNYAIFEKYVLFVYENNIIDGEPIKINGETYREALVKAFSRYIDKFQRKHILKANGYTQADCAVLKNNLRNINQKLIECECQEQEPNQE